MNRLLNQPNRTMNRLPTPFLLWTVVLLCALPQGGCVRLQQQATTPPILGTWAYTMTHPSQGTITGMMTIQERPDGTYTGHVSAVEIGIDEVLIVDRLDVDGPPFTMQGWLTGMELILRGTVGDDTIQGTNEVVGMETFTFMAQRAQEEP